MGFISGFGKIFSDRLPGNRPIIAGFVIAQIDAMTWPIEGHCIGAKAGDPAMLGGFLPGITAGIMLNDGQQIL